MKTANFTPDIAKHVMQLWKEHLGFYGGRQHLYYKDPKTLIELSNDSIQTMGVFQDRIGSKYSSDSKLTIKSIGGQIEFDCYAQGHGMMKVPGELAEDKFNKAVIEYIRGLESGATNPETS